MKPRFSFSPVVVSGAVSSAWRTYSMLYGEPCETDRGMLRTYLYKLVIKGERNQDQLTVKAIIFLKRQEERNEDPLSP